MKPYVILISVALFFASVTCVHAQDAGKDKRWGDEAEFTFVSTSGNTETTTLAGKNTLKVKFTPQLTSEWKVFALYSQDDENTTAERYWTDLRFDYAFTERFYAGVAGGWLRDRFAGFDNRFYGGPLAGYRFLIGPKHFLNAEVGVNYAREEYIDDTDANFFEGRAFGLYEYAFTEKTRFSQSGEFLYDFDDGDNYKANSVSAITVALTDKFALKTSYEIRYVNRPVPDTLEETDTILSAALVVNF